MDFPSPVYHTEYRIDYSGWDQVSGYFIPVYDLTPALAAAVGDVVTGIDRNRTLPGASSAACRSPWEAKTADRAICFYF